MATSTEDLAKRSELRKYLTCKKRECRITTSCKETRSEISCKGDDFNKHVSRDSESFVYAYNVLYPRKILNNN